MLNQGTWISKVRLTVIGMEHRDHDSACVWQLVRDIPRKAMLRCHQLVNVCSTYMWLQDATLTTHLASTPSINLIRFAVVSVGNCLLRFSQAMKDEAIFEG
jgi:hypothetical protein